MSSPPRQTTTPPRPPAPALGYRLLRGSSLYLVGNVVVAVVGLGTLPLHTLLLSPEDYGILGFVAVISLAARTMLTLGLDSAVSRAWHDHRDDPAGARRMVSTAGFLLAISVGCGGTLAAMLGGGAYDALFPGSAIPFDPYVRLALWGMIAEHARTLPLILLKTGERPGAYVALHVPITVAGIAFRLAALGWVGGGALTMLVASLVFDAAVALPCVAWLVWKAGLRPHRAEARALLAFGLPMVPHASAHWVLGLADRLVLERMVSVGVLGLYNFAYQLAQRWNEVNLAVGDAWAPMYYRVAGQGREAHGTLVRLQERVVAVLASGSLLACALLPDVVRVATDGRYHGAVPVIVVIIGAYTLHGLYTAFVVGIFFTRRTGVLPVLTGTAAALNVGLNLGLIPTVGVMGAAWATWLAYLFLALSVSVYSHLAHRLPHRSWFGWAAAIVLYGAAWGTAFVDTGGRASGLALRLGATTAFAWGLRRAGLLPRVAEVRAVLARPAPGGAA